MTVGQAANAADGAFRYMCGVNKFGSVYLFKWEDGSLHIQPLDTEAVDELRTRFGIAMNEAGQIKLRAGSFHTRLTTVIGPPADHPDPRYVASATFYAEHGASASQAVQRLAAAASLA